MKYAHTERFKRAYSKLPPDIQTKVVKAFQLFKENPRHPSLGVKRIQGMPDVWEGRIDIHYRFTFHYEAKLACFATSVHTPLLSVNHSLIHTYFHGDLIYGFPTHRRAAILPPRCA